MSSVDSLSVPIGLTRSSDEIDDNGVKSPWLLCLVRLLKAVSSLSKIGEADLELRSLLESSSSSLSWTGQSCSL